MELASWYKGAEGDSQETISVRESILSFQGKEFME
jgi:hypothetical protein